MGGAKSVPAHNVLLQFSRDGLPACKKLQAAAGKAGRDAKKDISTPPDFRTFCGTGCWSWSTSKKLPEERHKHMAKASGSLDFRGLRGAAPGSKDFASRAEAVRAPSKNGQFTGRSKFRDVCRHSGEVSQTAPETVCCPANASISLISDFLRGRAVGFEALLG